MWRVLLPQLACGKSRRLSYRLHPTIASESDVAQRMRCSAIRAFQHGVPAWRSSMAQWCSVAVAIQMTWSLLYSRRAECELMNAAGIHMAGGSGDSHEVRYAVPILWR